MAEAALPHRLFALACLVVALWATLTGCHRAPTQPHSVVLVLLDTLRADRLSVYGHSRETSPNIDRLAMRGVLFEQAVTSAPWTLPATVSLLTGEYPTARVFDRRLQRSLVERIRDAGFATGAFVEGGFVSEQFGFGRGFEHFSEFLTYTRRDPAASLGSKKAAAVHDIGETFGAAIDWLEAHSDLPFFLLVHTYEVHIPYTRLDYAEELERGSLPRLFGFREAQEAVQQRRSPTERRYIGALYDGGVRTADHHVGRLLEALRRVGRSHDTLVVVTSDHGEDLGHRPDGRAGFHGHTLYDELVRVPLIVFDPTRDFSVKRVFTQVRTLDVLPTVLERLGITAAEEIHGRSLVPLMEGLEVEHRPAYVSVRPAGGLLKLPNGAALRTGTHKLIVTGTDGHSELYELATDAGEQHDVATTQRERAGAMRQQLLELQRKLTHLGPARYGRGSQTRSRLKDQLRALGYVE